MLPSVISAWLEPAEFVPGLHYLWAKYRIRSCSEGVKELSLAPNLHLLMIGICPIGKGGLNHPFTGGAKSYCILNTQCIQNDFVQEARD